MPNVDKIIDKMHNQPNSIRTEEADKVLKAFGYDLARQKGSHRQYVNPATGDVITIKQDSTLKKVYVIDILRRIQR